MDGNFITKENKLVFNKVTQRFIDKPAIIMMKDIGSPLRIGEYKELESYFNSIPKELNENMELIQFNEFKLSAQEICNLFNYLQNYSIGKEKWDEIKSYNEVQMKGFFEMDRNFELDEVYEELDFIPEHKTFPVELKIIKREKYKPFFDFEDIPEDFEEL